MTGPLGRLFNTKGLFLVLVLPLLGAWVANPDGSVEPLAGLALLVPIALYIAVAVMGKPNELFSYLEGRGVSISAARSVFASAAVITFIPAESALITEDAVLEVFTALVACGFYLAAVTIALFSKVPDAPNH